MIKFRTLIESNYYTIQDDRKLYQIQAIRSFSDVTAGDLGGYVEKESNLSHDGVCWIYGDGCVCGDAEVSGNLRVDGSGYICNNVKINKHEQLFIVDILFNRSEYATFVKTDDGIVYVTCFIASRYFNGTIDELEKEVLNTYDKFSEYRRRYLNAIKMVKEVFKC
jgi:hypothetical protein